MLFGFETFELDTQRRELRQTSRSVSVEPQVFDLLEYLIRNRDRVVSKDDIIAAVWGGRIVSESTLTSRINSARSAIGDSGKAQRLIKTLRQRGIRFVGTVTERPDEEAAAIAFGVADASRPGERAPMAAPSIVVLPFANLSGDPQQDYFADGMVEDITMALGRLSWLFVIASSSALTYRGRSINAQQVGIELGVRYVLQGSVRRDRDRLRIAVQLTDATNGRHIFGDHFEGAPQEVFSIQDRVATKLSAALAPTLRAREAERARHKPTSNLTAYDLFLQALPPRRDNLAQNEKSLQLLYNALELDPSFSTAYGLAAWCHEIREVFGWQPRSEKRVKEGQRLARLAVETGEDDPDALWMAGLTMTTLGGETAEGATLVEKCLSLNPNSARAWWASGVIQTYLGHHKTALANFDRSRKLNPLDTAAYAHWTAIATTHFFAENYVAAQEALTKALMDWPEALPALRLQLAVCGLLRQPEKGRRALQQLLAHVPASTVDDVRSQFEPFTGERSPVLHALLQGLRQSGLA